MQKVLIALIHNNNEERNARIHPDIESLVKRLKNTFDVEYREFCYQPELKPHSRITAFLRDTLYEVLDSRWLRYRRQPPKRLLKTLRNLKKIALKYVPDSEDGRRRCHAGAIEVFVTSKHMRAWNACMESGCEFIFVFEDDAVFGEESIEKVAAALDTASKESDERPVYVDLAGGLPVSILQIGHLEQERQNGLVRYEKMVTNTACAYLLNRDLIDRSMQFLLLKPYYRLMGIDWLMNRFFMEFEKTGAMGACFHFDPPALGHGSFTGEFEAWQR